MNQTSLTKYKKNEVSFTEYLINSGLSLSIPENFEIKSLLSGIQTKLKNERQIKTEHIILNELHILEYKSPAPLLGKIGIGGHFALIILKNGQKINFTIQNSEWLKKLQTPKYSIKKFLKISMSIEIQNYIFDEIRNLFSQKTNLIDRNNHYITELSPFAEMSFYKLAQENEVLLSANQIEDLKLNNEEKTIYQNHILLISNQRQILLNEKAELIHFSKLVPIEKKTEIGRNRFIWTNSSFLPTKQNKKELEQMVHLPFDEFDSIRYILSLNKENTNYPKKLHQQLLNSTKNPYDELILIARGNPEEENEKKEQNIEIKEKIKQILDSKELRSYFTQWLKIWAIESDEQIFIIQFFLDFTEENQAFDDLLEAHRVIREEYRKKTKNKSSLALFDIGFCKHLFWSGNNDEAKKIIKQNIETLPDESIWDVLPPSEEIDEFSGQYIKIKYLELLYSVEEKEEKANIAKQLHKLQPLSLETALKTESIASKSAEIKNILQGNLSSHENEYKKINAQINDSLQKQIEHPLSSKNKLSTKLQNWLAEKDKIDHSLLKKYAETMDEKKYPQQKQIIENLKSFYAFNKLDIYIIYGEKSNDITVFEDNPPFLTIGKDFLDKTSNLYLSPQEFAFAIAAELSNLYFKSTYITSSDIWKGASKKGLFLVDTLFSIIPAAGFLSTTFKNIQKMDKLNGLLSHVQKIGDIGQTSINLIQNLNRLNNRNTIENKSENEIILSSRLLQISADRMGLMACGDIQASFLGILKQHQSYSIMFQRITENGLLSLINEKENNKLKHKDFAVRIAALFSFYLSDEFDYLQKKIFQKPEDLPPVFFK